MKNTTTLVMMGALTISWSAAAAEPDLSKLPPPSTQKGLTYAKDIRPLFEASCFRCHGEERHRGDLRLDSLDAVLKGGQDGKILTPGKSKESLLVVAVAQIDDESAMPPKRGGGPGGGGGRGGFGPGMMVAPQMISQGDKNGDKKLSKDEFASLADTWFDKLDTEKSGKLTQEQFTQRLSTVLPPPQGRQGGGGPPGGGQPPAGPGGPGGGQGGGRAGGQGGGRGGFGGGQFVGPGLFTAADTDKDGSLTRAELKGTFAKWFADWDTEKAGALDENKIRDGLNAALPRPNFAGRGGPGGPGGQGGPGGPGGQAGGGQRGGGQGPGGPGGGGGGPAPKPLTAEQVGLVRAWIDQGAK